MSSVSEVEPSPEQLMADAAESARIGRYYVLAAAIALAVTEIVVTTAYVMRIGTDRLPQQVIRFLLTLGLGYALMRRKMWARWVTLLLLLAACWTLTAPLLARGAFAQGQAWRTLPLLMMFVGYGVIIRGFLYSQSVHAYFDRSLHAESATPAA